MHIILGVSGKNGNGLFILRDIAQNKHNVFGVCVELCIIVFQLTGHK